jgi:hypothetical protein
MTEIKCLIGNDTLEVAEFSVDVDGSDLINAATGERAHVLGWTTLRGWGDLDGPAAIVSFGGPEIRVPLRV